MRMPASQARDRFSDVLNRAAFGGERVVLHRHGRDVAAVVSVEDLRLLERFEDEADARAFLEAEARQKESGERMLTLEELDARLGTGDDDGE